MKVFNLKEIDERYAIDEIGGGIKLKPFYTLAEKYAIYNDMRLKESSFDIDFSLIVLTAKFCTNIDFAEMDDNDIYDVVAELQLIEIFKVEIDEYLDMYKLVERDKNLYDLFKDLMDNLSKLNIDNDEIQKTLNSLDGVIGNGI